MPDDMTLFDVIYNCRAMRRLKPDPVAEETLVRLVEAAHQAPTGSNRQNTLWIIVRDTAQKAKLAELNKAAVMRYVAPGSGRPDSLPHQDDEKRRRMLEALVWQADHLHEVPALIVACLEFETPPADTFEAGAGAGGSIWPAVQNVLLTARALGFGATLTTLGLSDRPAAKAVLGLPPNAEPFAIIPVGYPMGNFGPVSRRPVHEVIRWDRYR